MTIKETQEAIVSERIIMNELRKGEFPSVSLIENKKNEYFKEKRAGVPRFTHRPLKPHDVSSSSDYNNMFNEIHEDLTVGFREVRTLNNQIMALNNYYETNRIQVERELEKLELKAETLMTKSTSSTGSDMYGDTISDFTKIDFVGDDNRNIPKTNAFVDLRYGDVMLDKIKNQIVYHDLSEESIGFDSITENTKTLHLAPVQNAFIDETHEAWRSVIVSKSADGVKGELVIELENPVYATHFSITSQTGKPLIGTLFLSEDGSTFQEYERRKLTSTYQWAFERQTVKVIVLQLEKQEEDNVNGMDYEYVFGAKSIMLREEQFMTEATFVSKPIPVTSHTAIRTIELDAEDFVPPDTSIRYYVGIDHDTNLIEWQEVRKGEPIHTGMTRVYTQEIDMFTDTYGELKYSQFGNAFYSIAKLGNKPLPNMMKMLMGRYAWMKETIAAPDEAMNLELYQTSMKDWTRIGTARKEYISVEQGSDTLEKGMCHRYTTHIFLEEDTSYIAKVTSTADTSQAFYVNNNSVKMVNNQYQLQLRAGWNKLQILTYSKEQDQEVVCNFYLRELSNRIYAVNEYLQQVSLYTLLYNTSNRVHTYYAVDEDNHVIVNYDPIAIDIMRNGVEYSVEYTYSTTDITEHKIRLMALLSKEGRDISSSPRLKNYKLKIE